MRLYSRLLLIEMKKQIRNSVASGDLWAGHQIHTPIMSPAFLSGFITSSGAAVGRALDRVPGESMSRSGCEVFCFSLISIVSTDS